MDSAKRVIYPPEHPGHRTIFVEKYTRDRQKYNNNFNYSTMDGMNEVIDGIFIGDDLSSSDIPVLASNDIKNVLCMAEEHDINDNTNINYIKYGVFDGHLLPKRVLMECIEEIYRAVKAGEKILVHCLAGISRSATIVIAYLIKHKNMGFQEALNFVRTVRPCVSPHPLMLWSLIDDFGDNFKE